MTAQTLADAWDDYAADLPRDTPAAVRVKLKRAFFTGAQIAVAKSEGGALARSALMAECIGFGRAIGTAAESA